MARGRVHFWPGGSLWIGRGDGRSGWHDHHALQISLPLDGECRLRSEPAGPWTTYDAALVVSHWPHEFEVDAVTMAQLFVEPETAEGRALAERFAGGDIVPLPEAERVAMRALLRDALRADVPAAAMVAAARAAVVVLAGSAPPSVPVDDRVARAIEHIRGHIDAPVALADAAAVAALSPSRFRHLFVQQTGCNLRVYLLWQRLNVAIEASMAGSSWTAAAHQAGFADSAHLTRTFRRMFGIGPTALVRS